MKTQDLLQLILDKFNESNGYAEMGEEKLIDSLKNCLHTKYRKEMDDALERLNNDGEVSEEDYEKEQIKVEENVIYAAQLLAATSREDLQNLV